jgi:hypothetical protein
MNITRILTIVFFLIAAGLAVFLFTRIKESIDQEKYVKRVEERIIDKLKLIRDLELAYLDANGQYTSDFDNLINFADSGKIFITERKEKIITLDYGADSVSITIDTLGSVPVRDSILSKPDYEWINHNQLAYVPPNNNNKFILFADKIDRNGFMVDVFEAKDPDPINPNRKGKESVRGPLKVGSRTEVSTSGNWE